ncbi:MAG: MOSC domain-containing protein [Proteobacteria bacterium]|nr:MOSC domain-containing protein [Pseudomonadota bacterium]
MLPAHIVSLHRHPVKGLSPETLDRVLLTAGQHFPGDRLFAIENGPSGFDAAQPVHQPKIKFLVLMGIPKLAALRSRYDDVTGRLSLHDDTGERVSGNLSDAADRTRLETFLAERYASDLRGPPRILAAPDGFRFMDSRKGFVSLLNLATLRVLAAKAGRSTLAPERFRANIIIDGLPPWGEFDLVGRDIRIGGARLRLTARIDRCAATHVDPVRGIRDLDLVGLMEREFSHHDCGVYAEVVESGPISVGQPLEMAGD